MESTEWVAKGRTDNRLRGRFCKCDPTGSRVFALPGIYMRRKALSSMHAVSFDV